MTLTLRRIVTVIALVNFVGCTTWTATHVPLSSLEGENVRLTTAGGSKLSGVLAHADSAGAAVLVDGGDSHIVVDTGNVMGVEKQKVQIWHTVALGLLAAGAVTLVLIKVLVFDDPDY
jgi:hypothetical protein